MRTTISGFALLFALAMNSLTAAQAEAQDRTVPGVADSSLITGAHVGFNNWGVEVFELERQGAFFQQGLDVGDVILSINGIQLTESFKASLRFHEEVVKRQGQAVKLEVVDVRTGSQNTIYVFLPFPIQPF